MFLLCFGSWLRVERQNATNCDRDLWAWGDLKTIELAAKKREKGAARHYKRAANQLIKGLKALG